MARGVALCLLIVFSIWLSHSYEDSRAAERPIHSSILALLCAGLSLQLSSKVLPGTKRTRRRGQSYSPIPLQDIGHPHASRDASPISQDSPVPTLSPRRRRFLFLLVVVCIVARVETFRRVIQDASCTQRGVEILLPTFIAVYDFIFVQRHKPPPPEYDAISNSIFDDMRDTCVNSSLRYLFPTIILSLAAYMTTNSALRSTYICPTLQSGQIPVSLVQYAGIFLDVVMIAGAGRLLWDSDDNRKRSRRTQCAAALLTAALHLTIGLVSYTIFNFQERKLWAMDLSSTYLRSAFSLAFVFSVVIHLVVYVAPAIRPLSLSVILVFACVYIPEVARAFGDRGAFPAQLKGANIIALLLAFLSIILFMVLEGASDSAKTLARLSRQMPTVFISTATTVFLITSILYIHHTNGVGFHPIDFSIYTARINSESWLKQASSSLSLKKAAANYKSRYGKPPPPNFDKWYAFAVEHQSMIIDDFDQIHEDLSPFWALQPAEIRAETNRILMNPWNEIAGISIRNGVAKISPHVAPASHQWMADGIALLINSSFSQWLPDMDLAFNLFDQPRIAVPFQEIERHKEDGKKVIVRLKKGADSSFSPDAAVAWNSEWMNGKVKLPDLGSYGSPFQLSPWNQSFHTHGTLGCPPKSTAASGWQWNPSEHCTGCAAPHSIGQFISNWTLSGEICHQPDMANLHSFYLAPTVSKVSNKLLPVFSQSKVHGYNDILYPSAWDYLAKSKYDAEKDVPFHEKRNTLFYLDSGSQDYLKDRELRGMERQRLNCLANNITNSTTVPMLINDNSLNYENVAFRDLEGLLHFNVTLTDPVQGPDSSTNDLDLQNHWDYRFLMDMDVSRRLIPFLLSNSVPFRSGIFRDWYDSRLTPWLHFVPIDTRFHGLYATLAYFAGLGDGKIGFERVGGKLIQMEGRQDQAEWIAEQGRKWAERALRKEDMEVYFFRLLLEWGRLVDDRRDEIGFFLT